MIGRFGGLALAWVALFGAANWRDAAQDPAPAAPRDDKFTHAKHVVRGWRSGAEPEVWRDCRGCHDYTPERLVSAPQEHCDACHSYTDGQGVVRGAIARDFKPGWEKDLSPYATRTRAAFRHHTHLMLECRECHAPPQGVRVPGGDYDIVTGPGQCARCHDEAAVTADDFAQIRAMKWFQGARDAQVAKDLGMEPYVTAPPADADAAVLQAFAGRLAAVFGGERGGLNVPPTALAPGGPFDHGDHGGLACAACHAAIPQAAAAATGVGDLGGDAAVACKSCHVDKDGATLAVAPPRPATRALHALGAFAHADHYRFTQPGAQRRDGVANAAAYAALEKPGNASCAHCHVQDAKAIGNERPDHPFTKPDGTATGLGRNRYLDCAVCHDAAAWSTGESPAKPLHDSSDGVIDGRTDAPGGGFAACAECHGVGGADFHAVPKAEVRRMREQPYLFGGQTHPYIGMTGADGRPQLQDCADCHRGRVPSLPSRLEQRPFRHAPHLPAQPTAADCLRCHPSAGKATTSAGLADADFRTYSLQECAACHLGATVVEAGQAALGGLADDAKAAAQAALAPSAMVEAFDHAGHVGKGLACAECHQLDAASGRDVATLPAARDCSKCHDHKSGGIDTKGAEIVYDDAVASCARCHPPAPTADDRRASVPPRRGTPAAATDARHQAALTAFAGFTAPQFHPIGRRCTECHTAKLDSTPGWPGLRVERADHLFGASTSPHQSARQGSVYEPVECLRCHWSPYVDGRDKYRGAVSREGDQDLYRLRLDPGGDAARKRFGNDRAGYPGSKARG